nr:protein SIEVE ELEMENT OCCLUSION B-like [Ipomoea batatas]
MATQPIPLSQPLILQPPTAIDDDTAIADQVSGEVEKEMLMPQKRIHKELSYQMIQLSFEKLVGDNDSIIKFIINLVKCVSELNQPPSSPPPQSLLLATYWITRNILACSQRILCVESKNEVMEESTLIAKSKTILSACYPLLEAKRTEKSYKALLHAFSHSHNNLEVLKLIFNVNNVFEKIFEYMMKELTEMTSSVGSVIDDIEERKGALVNGIRNTIDDWRLDNNTRIQNSIKRKYDIFFCGGNDAKCIQEFATKVMEVNSQIQLDIKFAYIGNNKKAKSLVQNISGYALVYAEYLRFWTRLRSAFLSRINYLNKTGRIEDEDKIFLGLQKLLAYEAKSTTFGAWVLLSKGEEVVACDLGDKMMRVMNAYQKWKNNIYSKGFSQAFKDCYEKLASSQDQHSCCMLEYPLTLDKIPEDVKCPQGSHNMHKFVTFTCCHDCHSS